jgi:hypothetical protein
MVKYFVLTMLIKYKLDQVPNTTSLVGTVYGGSLNEGGVLAPNGMIYFTHIYATQMRVRPD